MRIAFDVKGTLEGSKGVAIRYAFRQLQDLGHTCVVWSNSFSYAYACNEEYELNAETMSKRSISELKECGQPAFDVAIEDDRSQGQWLGAYHFVFVDEISDSGKELVELILTKMSQKEKNEKSNS